MHTDQKAEDVKAGKHNPTRETIMRLDRALKRAERKSRAGG